MRNGLFFGTDFKIPDHDDQHNSAQRYGAVQLMTRPWCNWVVSAVAERIDLAWKLLTICHMPTLHAEPKAALEMSLLQTTSRYAIVNL